MVLNRSTNRNGKGSKFSQKRIKRHRIFWIMKNIISNETCKKCAECCRNFPFVKLSADDISLLEKVTALPCGAFTNPKSKLLGEYFLQFKENGNCFFLNENNGSYSCEVYETRPGICKNYPSKPVQKEFCSGICINMNKNNIY
jgi:Fe-S-cluster containining protein